MLGGAYSEPLTHRAPALATPSSVGDESLLLLLHSSIDSSMHSYLTLPFVFPFNLRLTLGFILGFTLHFASLSSSGAQKKGIALDKCRRW